MASQLVQKYSEALGVEFRQPLFCGRKSLFLFAESEPHLRSAILCVVIETGAGNDGDANAFDKILREPHIFRIGFETNWIGIGEARNVRHDVVRAARLEHSESRARQNL